MIANYAIIAINILAKLDVIQMANLIVRNIDDEIVKALKRRASRHGVSAEAEHRKILEKVLVAPRRKSFSEVLRLIPNVGEDEDFERIQDDSNKNIFN